MSTTRFGIYLIGLALIAFIYVACTVQEQNTHSQQQSLQANDGLLGQTKIANSHNVSNEDSTKIPRTQAEQIAMEKIFNSHLFGCALDWDAGKWIYTVRARNSDGAYEVFIDAQTGEIIDIADETAKYQMKVIQGTAVMSVVDLHERDAAEETALRAYPGFVQEWKAIVDSAGHLAFSFDIQTEAGGFKKVIVAAGTHEIIKVK